MTRCFSANGLPLRGLDGLFRDDLEVEAKLLPELVLPLLDEAAGRDDEAALDVSAHDELLDEEPGHDRLAGAGVVREQEPERLAREKLLVDGLDLMRQRLEIRSVNGEVGIEEIREPDA